MVRPELLALGAALCWAVGSLFSARAASRMGTIGFNRWRLVFACTVLWLAVGTSGRWSPLAWSDAGLLALSGVVGICIGDTALFACMNRLGPRRSGVLFACHALFSALLAWWFLGETLWGAALVGSILLVGGVMVAVRWGRRETEHHVWEATRGRLLVGVALGLTAALCQALATLMVKPLMAAGVDALAGSAVRLSAALALHLALRALRYAPAQLNAPLSGADLRNTFFSAAIAMGLGMTLILLALQHGQANLVGLFSSVSPVLLLPMLWVVYRARPAAGAWWGAGMAVVGTALIMWR
ncbi:MAG: DMT family transporter [Betaproteobacteria bacterium]|nr:DMT family transporter [Betaproteobacteria bacterium]